MSASEINQHSVSTKQEVINILKANKNNFARFGVKEIGLFGSFVREEQTETSDVDLLVNLQNYNWDNYCQLLYFTEALFVGRKVDLITEDSIKGYGGVNICREVEYVD
jgi:predicted nucleotidyltransferase